MRLSTDFVAAILVGAALGWAIDRFFGTTPWAMILFLLLGFCAGVLNVMRSAGLVAENRALRPDSSADTKERNEDN
ncbi:MAG: AtpZ/AtpI family protein [Rhizobiaceae bacterium]|nr:AtpZ/AtpI family protein [Rhizobiaceae bacterium]